MWLLSREDDRRGVKVAKMRLMPEGAPRDQQMHRGYEWLTVLSGLIQLRLGERTLLIHPGQAAEFSTMTPHALDAVNGPAELLLILDHNGERAHLSADQHPS